MSNQYDVMAAGHLCLDVIPRIPETGAREIGDILRPGKLVHVEDATMCTGGPVSNTGINMKTLGHDVCFCARVGDDAFGKITSGMLANAGNADGIRKITGAASSYTIAIAPPNIDRIFLHNPGTNDEFAPEDLDPAFIAQCRHFHFGYPPLMAGMFANDGEDLERVFRIAKETGVTTSCDMALPDPESPAGKANWRRILERILPLVDLFLPSIEETLYMVEPETFLRMKQEHDGAELIDFLTADDYSRVADTVLGLGTKVALLKAGHRGLYIKTASNDALSSVESIRTGDLTNWSNRELWIPAFAVAEFGSATGSGDTAIAGFLSAFLRGLPIEQTLRYGVCCGWQNVQALDAISGTRSWDETTSLLAQNMPLIDLPIETEGWRWNQKERIWAGPNDMLNVQ